MELVANVRAKLADYAPRAAQQGVTLVIENHQDFTSRELVAFCDEAGEKCRDRLRHRQHVSRCRSAARLHARDRCEGAARASQGLPGQFTDEGYRLVRCAIGDGAVPFQRCWRSRGAS
jgi:hypothetical protein